MFREPTEMSTQVPSREPVPGRAGFVSEVKASGARREGLGFRSSGGVCCKVFASDCSSRACVGWVGRGQGRGRDS